jgi:nitronate monooxygenase
MLRPTAKDAADKLCQSKGFKDGKSLNADSTEACSAKVLIPGRTRKPDDCRTDYYVTRALCQWCRSAIAGEAIDCLLGMMSGILCSIEDKSCLSRRDFDQMSMPSLFKGRLSLPVIGAPLFIISVPDLVIAQCKAGIVGAFPALNARPPDLLDEWLARIREELATYDAAHPDSRSAPFAVNQIVHRSNNRLEHDLALCEKHKVPMIITSLGAREEVNQAAHRWGGIVFHDVINQKFAHKAIEKGADGLILVSAGAGGHAGVISPFAFVAETRQWFDGPIALSGAIGNGRAIRAARLLGADFAYVGSAFIATVEANAVEAYKRMITASSAEDIVYSNLFTGVHGNYLKPSILAAGMDPDNLPQSDASRMNFGTDASGERTRPKAWKDIWGSGQGVGSVGGIMPAGELIARFKREYDEAFDPPL